MIKTVTVINYLGERLVMDMKNPGLTGFYIENITGLGPSKASVNLVERTTMDGANYSSARVNSRNIVITLGFMFANSIEDVRHRSYRYFPIKKKVTLIFETDNRVCETYGYVEYNEPNIFSKRETTQISIICPDPYFYASGVSSVSTGSFSDLEPAFEFPFSNESLTEDLLEFGTIIAHMERSVYYSGDAEVGVVIRAHATGDVSNITFHNIDTGETIEINTTKMKSSSNSKLSGKEIISGDDIIISTVKGEKSVRLLRDGEYINILNYVNRDAGWFQLTKGDNLLSYEAESGATNLRLTIEYKTVYEGV